MLLPTRGKYLCKVLSRERKLSSGLWLADRIKSEKKDNLALCIGVGGPLIGRKGKNVPIIAGRGDIVHYKYAFAIKVRWERENYVFLKNDDIIAVENPRIHAVRDMVIVWLGYADKMNSIIVPDKVKQNSGDYWGEVVSVGPDYPDKSLQIGDKIMFNRNEGYSFKPYNSSEELLAIKEKWIGAKI